MRGSGGGGAGEEEEGLVALRVKEAEGLARSLPPSPSLLICKGAAASAPHPTPNPVAPGLSFLPVFAELFIRLAFCWSHGSWRLEESPAPPPDKY